MDRAGVSRSNTTGGHGRAATTPSSRPQPPGKPLPGVPGGATTVQRSNSTNRQAPPSRDRPRQEIRIPIPPPKTTQPQAQVKGAPTAYRPTVATVKRSNTTPIKPSAAYPSTTIRIPPATTRTTPVASGSRSNEKAPPPPPKHGALGRSKSESQRPGGKNYANKSEALKDLKAPLPAIPQGAVAKDLVLVAEQGAAVLDSGLPNVTSNHIVRVVESGGLCMKEAERALYGRHLLPIERIIWNRTTDGDHGMKMLLEWIERTRWGLASLGLHKFLASKSRGALIFNVHGRLQSAPDTPAVDWITFEEAQKTLDNQIQQYISTYDPATHVLIFAFRVLPGGDSLKIWGKKIGIPASLPVTYAAEINEIKKKLNKKAYRILLEDKPEGPSRALSFTRWFRRKKSYP